MPLTSFPSLDTHCSEKLQAMAPRLVQFLRMRGPVKSPAIEAELEISGVQVRVLVAWMRKQGQASVSKVASTENGYAWAPAWDDYAPTRSHMLQRAGALRAAVAGMDRAYGHKDPDQGELL